MKVEVQDQTGNCYVAFHRETRYDNRWRLAVYSVPGEDGNIDLTVILPILATMEKGG